MSLVVKFAHSARGAVYHKEMTTGKTVFSPSRSLSSLIVISAVVIIVVCFILPRQLRFIKFAYKSIAYAWPLVSVTVPSWQCYDFSLLHLSSVSPGSSPARPSLGARNHLSDKEKWNEGENSVFPIQVHSEHIIFITVAVIVILCTTSKNALSVPITINYIKNSGLSVKVYSC